MEVRPGPNDRPWPVPTHYAETRHPRHRAVYVRLPEGTVVGELLRWVRSEEHGWYGYVTWEHRRTLHTEPVLADRLEKYPYRSN